MRSELEIWKQLVTEVGNLKLFEAVVPYPLNRIAHADFLKDLQNAVAFPACLITFRSTDQKIEAATRMRELSWAALLAVRDETGKAYETALALLEKLRTAMLGKTMFEQSVWIKETSTVDAEPSSPRMAIYSLLFTTSQKEVRA